LTVPQVDPGNLVVLRYWQWYQYGSGDTGLVQIARFNGSGWEAWETLQAAAAPASSGGWVQGPPFDLTAYQGLTRR
jgi:hypothetical protein